MFSAKAQMTIKSDSTEAISMAVYPRSLDIILRGIFLKLKYGEILLTTSPPPLPHVSVLVDYYDHYLIYYRNVILFFEDKHALVVYITHQYHTMKI